MSTEALFDAIDSGSLDGSLDAIISKCKERLTAARKTRDANEYMVGDRVKFNDYCGTKYLHGEYAVITGKRRTKVTVKLERPVGRFARYENGEYVATDIIVPVSIIDKVA